MIAIRLTLELHADIDSDIELDEAGFALCHLLKLSDGALEGIRVRQAIVLGRAAVENAPPHASVSAYHQPPLPLP